MELIILPKICFVKSHQSALLLYCDSVSVSTGAHLFSQGSVRVYCEVARLNVKWKDQEKEERAAERQGYKWRRVGGGVDFDAIGMSSQAHEHRPNRT